MNIVDTTTGEKFQVEILPVLEVDFKSITKKRYFFNWKLESEYRIYKLIIKGTDDILGLISFEIIPEEWRIHVRLITVSIENKGSMKRYDKIIGNLLSFVSIIAVKEFGEFACVSLKPKTKIAKHYIEKYKMNITGLTLSLEVPEILDLIKTYNDEK